MSDSDTKETCPACGGHSNAFWAEKVDTLSKTLDDLKKKVARLFQQSERCSTKSTAGAGTSEMSLPVFKEPMLAHDFKKPECAGKIIFPAMAQRKIDGWRGVFAENNTFLSRNGKPIPNLDHIKNDLRMTLVGTGVVLDGELYSDRLTFQQLSALLQKKSVADIKAYESIHYIVFDVIMEGSNVKRQEWLTAFFAAHSFKHVKLLPNEPCKTKEDAERLKKQYIDEGYEGVMLRNVDAPYEHKRSNHLQKFKATSDAEFEVIGWQVDKDGGLTWECKTADGKPFHAKPDGTHADRVAAVGTAARPRAACPDPSAAPPCY